MKDPYPLPISATSSRALYHQVASLLIYQGVFDHPIGAEFLTLLRCLHHSGTPQQPEAAACLQAYGNWFRRLAASGQSWQDFLSQRLLQDDNPFSQWVQQQDLETAPRSLIDAAVHDLNLLQQVYYCSTDQILQWVMIASQTHVGLTVWQMANQQQIPLSPDQLWGDHLGVFAEHYQRKGVGVFAQYRAFRWQQDQLQPVPYADRIQLGDLVGYDGPQKALCQNTECLLQGLPALNVLLYGSRGSGKSSLVKALLNHYGDRGLRLIEVSLDNLTSLPMLVELLRDTPQKFIIFVDDLSFEEDDERFKNLKVILEGNVVARPDNVVIYATSNRRHLIREFFGDRPAPQDAEEVQAWDTVQEKLSFRDRFGLTLTFLPANQKTYLEIVFHLAQRAGLTMSATDLEFRAKQWATQHNGRSGRTARQFVDYLIGEQRLKRI
ncbi:MAG: ATP-binding protein [Synechocystis sp.]|nr:ATP-binding protein [Synechocystis sp.]